MSEMTIICALCQDYGSEERDNFDWGQGLPICAHCMADADAEAIMSVGFEAAVDDLDDGRPAWGSDRLERGDHIQSAAERAPARPATAREFLGLCPNHPVYAHLLRHGRPFDGKPKPDGVGLRTSRQTFCYRNALRAALRNPRFIYSEGVAKLVGFGGFTEHAWLLDTADGRAVDIAWRTPSAEYYGIAFDTRRACSASRMHGRDGVLPVLFEDPTALDGAEWKGGA
jgi:hypothetical protein